MVSKVAQTVVESLKGHPGIIGLLVLNCAFLGASAWTTYEIAANSRVREASFHSLLRDCIDDKRRM